MLKLELDDRLVGTVQDPPASGGWDEEETAGREAEPSEYCTSDASAIFLLRALGAHLSYCEHLF